MTEVIIYLAIGAVLILFGVIVGGAIAIGARSGENGEDE